MHSNCNLESALQEKNKTSQQVTERVGRIRERILSTIPEIFMDRAQLITESYQETIGSPYVYRRAKALENILLNMKICIGEDELIVGSFAGKPRGCQLFPEYDIKFIVDELDTINTRKVNRFFMSAENKEIAKKIYKQWQGSSLADYALSIFPAEAKRASSNLVILLAALGTGVGHMCVNYEYILKHGLYGILAQVKEFEENLDFDQSDYAEKLTYYKAIKIVCQAAIEFAERFAVLAEVEAQHTTDQARRAELLEMARICRRVPAYPADTFWEALQSFWFIQLILHLETGGHSISPGRFDQYMDCFYAKETNREFCEELLHCLWLKFNEVNKVRNKASAIAYGGYPMFQNLIVGGQNAHGECAVNELSHLCLEATAKVSLPQPSLSLRWYYGSPENFLKHAMQVVACGTGMPALFNDEVLIPNMLQLGYTLEEARNYAIIGCTETSVPGNTEPWLTGGYLNLLKILELTIFNGFDPVYQVQYNYKTGHVEEFESYDAFVRAYYSQLIHYEKFLIMCNNILDTLHGQICPTPFESMLMGGCLEKGKTSLEGGARYNFTTFEAVGIANIADSLAVIKSLIYEKKELSWNTLKAAMLSNYEGQEKLRQHILNQVPKYGNDDDYVDLLGRDVLNEICKEAAKHKNARGGKINIALYTIATNVMWADDVGATPDGRKKGMPLADGGVSCSRGMDKKGLTALLKSVVKLDPYQAVGSALLNVRLSPELLNETNFPKTLAIIKTYFMLKGQHVQFNVFDVNTLRDAQKHPENYPLLMVRVAGFSALFTTLDPFVQEDIIKRTEHSSL